MKKKAKHNYYLMAAIMASLAFAVLAFYNSPSGYVPHTPSVPQQKQTICEVQFGDLKLPLSNAKSSNECQKQYATSKETITYNICANTETLGDVLILYDDKPILIEPLFCDESLASEGVPITAIGEFIILHMDDFKKGTSIDHYKIKQDDAEYYLLTKAGRKPVISEAITGGTKIEIRAIKMGDKMILADDKAIRRGQQ